MIIAVVQLGTLINIDTAHPHIFYSVPSAPNFHFLLLFERFWLSSLVHALERVTTLSILIMTNTSMEEMTLIFIL